MRRIMNREDSLRYGLSFFLLLGSVLGTLFCNRMNEEMKNGLYAMERELVTLAALSELDLNVLFFRILPKRIGALCFILLISGMRAAPIIFCAAACCAGFLEAVKICALTMDAGILGLWKYSCFLFPHGLIYIPILYLLFWWLPVCGRRLTWVSVSLLAAGVTIGAAMECLIHPWVLALC